MFWEFGELCGPTQLRTGVWGDFFWASLGRSWARVSFVFFFFFGGGGGVGQMSRRSSKRKTGLLLTNFFPRSSAVADFHGFRALFESGPASREVTDC